MNGLNGLGVSILPLKWWSHSKMFSIEKYDDDVQCNSLLNVNSMPSEGLFCRIM